MTVVVNEKSDVITDITTVPNLIPIDPTVAGGVVRSYIASLTMTDGLTTSTYTLVRLPSNSRVCADSVLLFAAAVACADIDIGIFHTTLNSTATGYSSVDCFMASGVKTAGAVGIAHLYDDADISTKRESRLWELAGAASDPGAFYDVVITANAAMTGGEVNADIRVVSSM